ncbi:DNA-binding transcriptional regulator, LysR family [Kaistia soli DSM 19436]|uniref:DNA-binding transcriptional regulator, LysR family n=1 Tax=Kaistia soli DSM 19436 TaxID=1122133 RepID=A0A1M5MGT4_9HYPH|nr:LysR family transcriptional regulator [Kaistia soli]SHG76446.1 DNA-binding transcriptional regulator, LysR family [Kaistia soli DSM 19436]
MDPLRLGLVSPRLHYFQLVARLGSIRKAARMLNVAPSSISRALAQFEEELDTPLFDRSTRRLKLTSAGELMLYRARASGAELARAMSELGELKGLRRGAFSIAVVESVARGLTADALAIFWQRYPEITVDMRVVDSRAAFAAVAEGDCEIGIAFDIAAPKATQRLTIVELGIGALVTPDHRFAGRTGLRLHELAGERIIVSDNSLSLGRALEEALEASGVGVVRRMRTNSIELMVDLASRGLGVALQTRVGIESEVRDGRLAFVPIRDPRLKPRRLTLVTRGKGETSEAATALAAQLSLAMERAARSDA